jgi:cation diffusion facilitator family transporter
MDPRHRDRRAVRVLLVTLLLNLAVASAKVGYGRWAHVLSIEADGFHSVTDAANNVIGVVAIVLAGRPADSGHPYGHQKFELLAAGVVGLSLLTMAWEVAKTAVLRWTSGSTDVPHIGPGAFVVLVVTLLVNLWVARYERREGERLHSGFLLTDSAHTRSDVLVSLAVLLTVVFVKLGYPALDVVAALAVAAFIAWAGIGVLRHNLDPLADAAQLDKQEIERIVCAVPGVASAHKIRTRGTPGHVYVDLHVQIAPHLDVVRAHRVTHWVIDAIQREIAGVQDVVVHTEPARPEQSYKPLPEDVEPATHPSFDIK